MLAGVQRPTGYAKIAYSRKRARIGKGGSVLDQVQELLADFLNALEVRWAAPMDLLRAAQDVLVGCSGWPMRNLRERDKILLGLVNSKLRLNRDRFQTRLDGAAGRRVALNY